MDECKPLPPALLMLNFPAVNVAAAEAAWSSGRISERGIPGPRVAPVGARMYTNTQGRHSLSQPLAEWIYDCR